MTVTPEDLELGIKLAGLMLSRRLTPEEEQLFTFAAGYGAGVTEGKRRKLKKNNNPFNKILRIDI